MLKKKKSPVNIPTCPPIETGKPQQYSIGGSRKGLEK